MSYDITELPPPWLFLDAASAVLDVALCPRWAARPRVGAADCVAADAAAGGEGAGRVVGRAALLVVLPFFLIHLFRLHLVVGVDHPEEVLNLQDTREWEQSN